MRCAFVVALAVTLSAVAAAARPTFDEFKAQFGKSYATPADESAARAIFDLNAAEAEMMAERNPLAKFSAWTPAGDTLRGSAKRTTSKRVPQHPRQRVPIKPIVGSSAISLGGAFPAVVDWRTRGAVTPPGNEGQCGDAAAYTMIAVAEGRLWLQNNHRLVPLATNEITTCFELCQGANVQSLVDDLISKVGGALYTAESYAKGAACPDPSAAVGALLRGYFAVPGTAMALTAAVANEGPVGVALYAMPWQTYTGGIMTDCGNQTSTDAADDYATVVGYDDSNQPPYWIVKNSWGQAWGEEGYIRIARGSDQCVIHTAPFSLNVVPPA